MTRLGLLLVLGVLTTAACGGDGGSPPPSTPPPSGGGGDTITGNERIGWDQTAADAAELTTFRYAIYVDGNRSEMANASCGGFSNGTAPCTASLPSMSAGSHTLELASFVVDGDNVLESAKSAPLRVTVRGDTAGAAAPGSPASPSLNLPSELVTADGIRLRLDVTADDLQSPTSLVFAPDGLGFVAERAGRVRLVRDGIAALEPALVLDDVFTAGLDGGVLALTLDKQFERTRLVFALYTTVAADGTPRFRVVRFREAGDQLGERVILLDDVVASAQPAGALAVGPDGKLYVAFDDADQSGLADSLGSYSGKVLRLDTDGRTPSDQPSSSPVLTAGYRAPRGLDWQPSTGTLWSVDARDATAEELRIFDPATRRANLTRGPIAMPAGMATRALTFYDGGLLPGMSGDLLVASANGYLSRVKFAPRDPAKVASSERLLDDIGSGLSSVSVSPDGAVYFTAGTSLVRLFPQ